MSPTEWITLGLQAVVTIGGYVAHRFDANQTATMQAAAAAKTDAQLQAQAEKDVASGDLNKIREDAS